MNFSYNGKQIRRSTETSSKKLAEKIHAKVMTLVAEGKWLDIDKGKNVTFRELLEKYLQEHSSKKAPNGARRDGISAKTSASILW